jgi:hypothetical protein
MATPTFQATGLRLLQTAILSRVLDQPPRAEKGDELAPSHGHSDGDRLKKQTRQTPTHHDQNSSAQSDYGTRLASCRCDA